MQAGDLVIGWAPTWACRCSGQCRRRAADGPCVSPWGEGLSRDDLSSFCQNKTESAGQHVGGSSTNRQRCSPSMDVVLGDQTAEPYCGSRPSRGERMLSAVTRLANSTGAFEELIRARSNLELPGSANPSWRSPMRSRRLDRGHCHSRHGPGGRTMLREFLVEPGNAPLGSVCQVAAVRGRPPSRPTGRQPLVRIDQW
jgi:hypothetical protein